MPIAPPQRDVLADDLVAARAVAGGRVAAGDEGFLRWGDGEEECSGEGQDVGG